MNNQLQSKIFELLQQLTEDTPSDLPSTPSNKQKKKKKNLLDDTCLFQDPFFELPKRSTYSQSPYVIARCRTCGVLMRGNKKLSAFVNHMKDVHPEKYDLYLSWPNEDSSTFDCAQEEELEHTFKRPQEVNERYISDDDDVIILEDDVKNEEVSFCDETTSFASDYTLDESTTKLITEILDDKIIPVLEENKQLRKQAEAVQELRHELYLTKRANRFLEEAVQSLERDTKCNSLLVRGLSYDGDTFTPDEIIQNLLYEIMSMNGIVYEKVELLPPPHNNSTVRSMVVTFPDRNQAHQVYSQRHKLRSTGIYLEPIITANGKRRKNMLMKLRAEIMRLDATARVHVSGTTLSVGGYTFEWNILNHLTVVNRHMHRKSAIECLKEATGLNLKSYVESIANEANAD